jgi:hypothetical protein
VAREILAEIVHRNQVLLAHRRFFDGLLFAHGRDDIVQLVEALTVEEDGTKHTDVVIKKLESGTIKSLILDRVCFIDPIPKNPLQHKAMPEQYTVQIAHRLRSKLPILKSVVPHPMVRADSTIVLDEGFDEATGFFVQGNWNRLDVPDEPSAERVAAAVAKLREPFAEMAFEGDEQEAVAGITGMLPKKQPGTEMTPSEANAIGCIVAGLIRHLLADVPFGAFTSPQYGVGKGLGFDVPATIVDGHKAHNIPLQNTIHMLESAVTMAVRDFPDERFFKLDEPNSGRPFFSHLLASFATAGGKSGVRPPWARKATELDLHKTFAFTGVNFTVTRDWVRRIFVVSLAAQADGTLGESRTFKRFRDKETLLRHVRDHRAEYIEAIVVLVRNWEAKGRPRPDFAFDYPDWVDRVGGAMVAAGITSWMANRNDVHDSAEGVQKGELLLRFYDLLEAAGGVDPSDFKASDLAKLAQDADAAATDESDMVSALVSWADDRNATPWTTYLIALIQGDRKRVASLGRWFESINGMILGNNRDLVIAVQGLGKRGNARRWKIIVQRRPQAAAPTATPGGVGGVAPGIAAAPSAPAPAPGDGGSGGVGGVGGQFEPVERAAKKAVAKKSPSKRTARKRTARRPK